MPFVLSPAKAGALVVAELAKLVLDVVGSSCVIVEMMVTAPVCPFAVFDAVITITDGLLVTGGGVLDVVGGINVDVGDVVVCDVVDVTKGTVGAVGVVAVVGVVEGVGETSTDETELADESIEEITLESTDDGSEAIVLVEERGLEVDGNVETGVTAVLVRLTGVAIAKMCPDLSLLGWLLYDAMSAKRELHHDTVGCIS